jgi:microcystin-dependent protein
MTKRAWLTRDDFPPGDVTLEFILPDDDEWRAQLRGALLLLCDPSNWEQFGDLSPQQMADRWTVYILKFFEENRMFLPGMIMQWASGVLPDGWLWCDGAKYQIATYPDLYLAIGETYVTGSFVPGVEFFVPDCQRRVPVGRSSSGGSFAALGERGGAENITLALSQIPSHTHLQDAHNHAQIAHGHMVGGSLQANSGGTLRRLNPYPGTDAVASQSVAASNLEAVASNQNAGGGQSHSNLQPYIVLNSIIRWRL